MPSQRRTINEFNKIEKDIKDLRSEFKEIRDLINNLRKIMISDKEDLSREYVKIDNMEID